MSTRPHATALDEILGREFGVLDHGFVRVVDYLGGDDAVVQAARVSYGSGTRTRRDDRSLIRYLLANGHTTPFEMAEIKLHVKLPIFVARQWIRHRTASVNEYSARYSVLDREFYVPDLDAVAAQSASNRQGRGDALDASAAGAAAELIARSAERAYDDYLALLNQDDRGEVVRADEPGLARELARSVLPVSFYTQWYWKTDLHNLMRFLELRLDPHAQWEIRQYAEVILGMLKAWAPVCAEAFSDYRLDRTVLSGPATRLVRAWLDGERPSFEASGLGRREWDDLHHRFGRAGAEG